MRLNIFVFLFASSLLFSQTTPKDIIIKCVNAIEKHNSVSYNSSVKFKYFSVDDTSKFSGKCELLRVKSDTIFNGKIRKSVDDTFNTYTFYDLDKIYFVENKEKKVTVFNPHKGQEFGMTGNTSSELIWLSFLKPDKYLEFFDIGFVQSLLKDTLVNGRECYKIMITKPEEESMKFVSFICIDKKNYIPLQLTGIVKYQGEYQYSDVLLNDYVFDKVTDEQFSVKQIPSDYSIEDVKIPDEAKRKLLDSGTVAPAITGKNYKNGMNPDSVVFAGNVTLLDFWYMACGWCIKAFPQIEKIYEKYAGKIQIIGINSYDNNDKNLKKMPKFLEFNPIKYSILLTEKDIPDSYKVSGWPTFYIIDQQGKISYSTPGYSEKLFEELDVVIGKLVDKVK